MCKFYYTPYRRHFTPKHSIKLTKISSGFKCTRQWCKISKNAISVLLSNEESDYKY